MDSSIGLKRESARIFNHRWTQMNTDFKTCKELKEPRVVASLRPWADGCSAFGTLEAAERRMWRGHSVLFHFIFPGHMTRGGDVVQLGSSLKTEEVDGV